MLNPKLQTLNSFGFLRESKKTLNIPGTLLQEIIITSRIENFQSTAGTLRASRELWNSNAKSTAKITAHSRCVSKQNAPLLQQRFQHHMNCIQVKANCNIKSKVNLWTFLPFTQENINQDKIHVQCKWNQISFLLWRQLSLWYISKTMVDLISPATGMSSIYGTNSILVVQQSGVKRRYSTSTTSYTNFPDSQTEACSTSLKRYSPGFV